MNHAGETSTLVDRESLRPMAEEIFALYGQLSRWWAHDFKRGHGSCGLTDTQSSILARINRSGPLTVSQLAEYLDLSVPTVVRAVDALERKQFVTRRRSHADLRQVLVEETEMGSATQAAFQEGRRERFMRLLSLMSEDEVQSLIAGYRGLARATGEIETGEPRVG